MTGLTATRKRRDVLMVAPSHVTFRHRSTVWPVRCPCRRNVPVQRGGGYPEAVGNLRHADVGIGEQCPRDFKVVLSQFWWSAAGAANTLGGGNPRARAL